MSTLFPDDRPDRARRSDPQSSHDAVPSFVDRRNTKYKQVMTACRALPGVFSDDDIEAWIEKRYAVDLNRNDVAKRRQGVEADRMIFRVGLKARKGDGRMVMHFRFRTNEDPPIIDGRKERTLKQRDDEIAARLATCEFVEVDYVEHVRYEGHDYYLAHDLLEALREDLT